MMLFVAFGVDLGFLILNSYMGITNRGTWIGWLFTALVLWQVFTLVNAIRSVYDEG